MWLRPNLSLHQVPRRTCPALKSTAQIKTKTTSPVARMKVQTIIKTLAITGALMPTKIRIEIYRLPRLPNPLLSIPIQMLIEPSDIMQLVSKSSASTSATYSFYQRFDILIYKIIGIFYRSISGSRHIWKSEAWNSSHHWRKGCYQNLRKRQNQRRE